MRAALCQILVGGWGGGGETVRTALNLDLDLSSYVCI